MSNCCPQREATRTSTNGTSQTSCEMPTVMIGTCPACGTRGKKVDLETVKAMLRVSLRGLQPSTRRLAQGSPQYHFCRTSECEVVYFAGEEHFTTDEVRVRVHQKHPNSSNVPVCYCFRHTPGSIRAEWLAIGMSTAVADVTAGIQAGQCACEIRNPQGACCLGNVRKVVKRIQQEAQQEELIS